MRFLGVKVPEELEEMTIATGRPKWKVVREELISLIDERIAFYHDKTKVKPIIEAIESFHGRGREPLVSGVAEKVGMDSRPTGILLKKHGIQSRKTHRQGAQGRYLTFDLRDRIEAMLKAGAI